jgi:CBS domain-containing protein
MLQHNLHDVPVVGKERQLIGMVSRVDIGTMILSAWAKAE